MRPSRDRSFTILRAIYNLSSGTTLLVAYEDIVVEAWKLAPQEFGLRGYADLHPDASDVHKPLYGPLKEAGLVTSGNKKFGLTELGLARVEDAEAVEPRSAGPSSKLRASTPRVERLYRGELLKLKDRAAVKFVSDGQAGQIIDTDMYDFYGLTVRTPAKQFRARLELIDEAIRHGLESGDPSVPHDLSELAKRTHEYLQATFGPLISRHLKG